MTVPLRMTARIPRRNTCFAAAVRKLSRRGGAGMAWRLEDNSKRKYEAARRFGLTDKLAQVGWAGLSAKEAGRIGGSMHGKRKHTED